MFMTTPCANINTGGGNFSGIRDERVGEALFVAAERMVDDEGRG
jgi:hypothetical protein